MESGESILPEKVEALADQMVRDSREHSMSVIDEVIRLRVTCARLLSDTRNEASSVLGWTDDWVEFLAWAGFRDERLKYDTELDIAGNPVRSKNYGPSVQARLEVANKIELFIVRVLEIAGEEEIAA